MVSEHTILDRILFRARTWRAVVADGVPRLHAEDSARSTLDGGAANLLRVLPDNLSEVAEGAKSEVRRGVGRTVDSVEASHLFIVPLVGDGTGGRLIGFVFNISSRAPRSQVLSHGSHRSVSSLAGNSFEIIWGCLRIVLEDTRVSELLRPAG